MSDKKNRLGKGLGAIFGDDVSEVLEEIQRGSSDVFVGDKTKIAISEIVNNPYQPRKQFDETKIQELAASILEHGVVTPILVRKSTIGFELIAGERRLRASKLVGFDKIDAIVVDFNDDQMMEVSLIENIQREDLNIMEEAEAYQKMMTRFDYTQESLAKKVGKSREHIANTLRLNKLPKEVAKLVSDNQLSMGHVRPLIPLMETHDIVSIARKIVKEGLSVRAVEKLVSRKETKPKIKKDLSKFEYVTELFEKKTQTKVVIDDHKIQIHYHGDDDLNRILEVLDLIEKE
jgi:ParB family chromosome partitioning protein